MEVITMCNTKNKFIEGCDFLDRYVELFAKETNWQEIMTFSFDQEGFNRRLVFVYGALLRYVMDEKDTSYVYTGKTWSLDVNGMYYLRIIQNTLKFCSFELAHRQEVNAEAAQKMAIWLEKLSKKQLFYPLMNLAVEYNQITCYSTHFDKQDHLLTCKNGVIDLRTGQLFPFCRKAMLTKYVDIELKAPDINGLNFFMSVINQAFLEDKENVDFMQRLFGSFLYGGNPDQKFIIFHGGGRNSKSLFTSLLQSMMPELVQNVNSSTFTAGYKSSIRSDIARTKGARLILADETNPNAFLEEKTVKQITSNELITARELYKNEISFRPTFSSVLNTNNLPGFVGQDLGIKRRLMVVNWPYTVPVEMINPNLGNELLAQKESIFYWMVLGAKIWFENGLGTCAAVEGATSLYIEESNSVLSFLKSCCQKSADHKIPAQLFYDYYVKWCNQNGSFPLPIKVFSKEVTGNCIFPIIKDRDRNNSFYQGIEFFR